MGKYTETLLNFLRNLGRQEIATLRESKQLKKKNTPMEGNAVENGRHFKCKCEYIQLEHL